MTYSMHPCKERVIFCRMLVTSFPHASGHTIFEWITCNGMHKIRTIALLRERRYRDR